MYAHSKAAMEAVRQTGEDDDPTVSSVFYVAHPKASAKAFNGENIVCKKERKKTIIIKSQDNMRVKAK